MKPIVLGLVLAASISLPAFAAEPDGPTDLITQTDAVRIEIQGRLAAHALSGTEDQVALAEYYAVPDQHLLWVDENGVNARGKAVMAEIAKADDYGLRASDYSLPDASDFNGADAHATDWLATAEIKISRAVLDYAHDARGGRLNPQQLNKNLDPTLALPNPSEVLGSIAYRADPAAYLRSFQPDNPQFEALRKLLIEARNGKQPETSKPDVVVIPDGPLLKLGVEDPQVALLRTRLNIPAKAGANKTLYDQDVFRAVRRFQQAHGSYPDGIVGPGTRRLLNAQSAPIQIDNRRKIDLLIVNMERWRWLPRDLGPFYVTVNIPEFKLRIVKDGKPIHEARVVVGKPEKQTPVFSDEMEEIVFRPNWYVPNSIKTEEIAPYLYQGGGFFGGGWDTSVLKRHNLHIRSEWTRYRSRLDRLGPRRYPQIRTLPAARPGQCARLGEVPVPQQARCLHARHDAEEPVCQDDSCGEPWLHARAVSRPDGNRSAPS